MASLVEELISVLVEEEELYRSLVDLGERKCQIIIDANIPALEELTIVEQEKSDLLLALSNKQVQLLKDIKTVLGKQDEEITVTRLICYLSSQPETQERLTVARDNLINSATKIYDVYKIKHASPKEKKRYFSPTAYLYTSKISSLPVKQDTSIIKVLSGRWKLVINPSTHFILYGG